MTRVTPMMTSRSLLLEIQQNQERVDRYSRMVSTGAKVIDPADSTSAGTISQYQQTLAKIDGYKSMIDSARGFLSYQSDIITQASDVLIQAEEIAAQISSEAHNPPETRRVAFEQLMQLRDQLATLANSKYQGRYIYGGNDDDDPPYDKVTYSVPGSGPASVRYVYDTEGGHDATREVPVSEDLTVRLNTPGNQVFDSSIQALERLARTLMGYSTSPATGTPDGGGGTYNSIPEQTSDILRAIDMLRAARADQLMPEQANVTGRLMRLDTASSVLETAKSTSRQALSGLVDADISETATYLQQAEDALKASFLVSNRVLNLTILDYL